MFNKLFTKVSPYLEAILMFMFFGEIGNKKLKRNYLIALYIIEFIFIVLPILYLLISVLQYITDLINWVYWGITPIH